MSRMLSIDVFCDNCETGPMAEQEASKVDVAGGEVDLCSDCALVIKALGRKGRKISKTGKPGKVAKVKASAFEARPVNRCGRCGKSYPTRRGLVVHTSRMHKGGETA